jgi:hypothetical protein
MEIQDGKYRGKAKASAPILIESGKGTPGISVEIAFLDPALAGASLTWTGWLSDGAFDRTVESLRILGWAGAELDNVSGLDANEVEVVVKAEEYDGNWYPRIQFINRLGGALGAPMAPDKAKKFAAAMRARIQALDAAKGTSKPTNQKKQSSSAPPASRGGYDSRDVPPPSDDDIPF